MTKEPKASPAQLEILLALQDHGKDARRMSAYYYHSALRACSKRGWIACAGNGAGEAWVYITPSGRGAIHRVLGVRAAPLLK